MGLDFYYFHTKLKESFDSDLKLIEDYDMHFKTELVSTPEMREAHYDMMKKSFESFNKKYIKKKVTTDSFGLGHEYVKKDTSKTLGNARTTQLAFYNDKYGISNPLLKVGDLNQKVTEILDLESHPRAQKGIARAVNKYIDRNKHINDVTLRDLIQLSEAELLSVRQMGKSTIRDIRWALEPKGYSLRKE
jgi:hypothetical protein